MRSSCWPCIHHVAENDLRLSCLLLTSQVLALPVCASTPCFRFPFPDLVLHNFPVSEPGQWQSPSYMVALHSFTLISSLSISSPLVTVHCAIISKGSRDRESLPPPPPFHLEPAVLAPGGWRLYLLCSNPGCLVSNMPPTKVNDK